MGGGGVRPLLLLAARLVPRCSFELHSVGLHVRLGGGHSARVVDLVVGAASKAFEVVGV